MTTAPDLYFLDADQLSDELLRLDISHSVPTPGGTVHSCTRRCPLTDEHQTAALFQADDGTAVLALPAASWH